MGGKDLQVFLPDPRNENTGAAAGQAGQQAQHTLARYQYRVKCGSNETCSIHCLKKKKKEERKLTFFCTYQVSGLVLMLSLAYSVLGITGLFSSLTLNKWPSSKL